MYLSDLLTQYNGLKREINRKTQKGTKCRFELRKILINWRSMRNLKIQTYITLIRPIVLCASEICPLRKIEELKLSVFERKILGRI